MLSGVVAELVLLRLGDDVEKGRVAVRCPIPEGEAAGKNSNAGEKRIEEIECADCANADEIEQRALDA